ncbi:MAG: hypothetical protein MUC36_21705 [Planctomycetes bacterium]|jgi:hypothetical protein|nr:hypothetical protein [Planctomycetota bacterium]
MKFALLLSLLAVALPAQSQFRVPDVASPVDVNLGIASGIGRYQQWFSALAVQNAILAQTGNPAEPIRFTQIEFFAGLPPTSQAALIDCEILLGHGKFSGVFGTFDTNWDSPPVIVRPRTNINLVPGPTGSVCFSVPLPTRFTWDAFRPVLMEIRVYGNSLPGSPSFGFNFRGSTTSIGTTTRIYAGGSAGAINGSVQQGVGMVTRFTTRQGATLPYGTGCPGDGGFVPVAEVLEIPQPGMIWNHRVSNAASQRLCIWTIGGTNTTPLQLDLTQLLGFGASGCLLRNEAVNTFTTTTVGGGAGGGLATLTLQLPATGGYVGLSLFTQWVVFDPLAQNGVLSVTNGNWSIVSPVGG